MSETRLFEYLTDMAENISLGKYKNPDNIFKMTRQGKYPETITRMAEAFCMMLVKVEAREYHLEGTIESLRKTQNELEEAKRKLEQHNRQLTASLKNSFSPATIMGTSRAVREIREMIQRISDTPVNVLISGESGTGKELVAKSLHYSSERADEPFIAINCGALPDSLMESEMFGIEKGVATGVDRRAGKIETARRGTLFLDEIGEMSAEAQVKLLRVIQERVMQRIGGSKNIPVHARILAATNKDLKNEIASGRFREDLYYRLKVISIHVPPLRERMEDIKLLFQLFLDFYTRKFSRPGLVCKKDVFDILMSYDWPGNIRELENEAERLAAMAYSSIVTPDMLSEEIIKQKSFNQGLKKSNSLEIDIIRKALKSSDNNKTRAAKILGISREGLRKKMIRLGISGRPEKKAP